MALLLVIVASCIGFWPVSAQAPDVLQQSVVFERKDVDGSIFRDAISLTAGQWAVYQQGGTVAGIELQKTQRFVAWRNAKNNPPAPQPVKDADLVAQAPILQIGIQSFLSSALAVSDAPQSTGKQRVADFLVSLQPIASQVGVSITKP